MLYLSGIILSFFLAFLLFTKKNKSAADNVLIVWLCVIGFHLVTFYLFYTEQHLYYPTLTALGFPLPLAHGPFLFLYTVLQTSATVFNKKQLLHFLPVVLSYLLFTPFYLLSFEEKVEVFMQKGQGFELPVLINLYAIYISGVAYITLSLIKLLKYRKNLVHRFSNTEKINFNWLLYLIIWMVVIWAIVLLTGDDKLIFGAVSLFVLWIGYFGIKQVQVFKERINEDLDAVPEMETETTSPGDKTSVKYQKSYLTDEEAAMIHQRLKILLEEEKPYLNPDLALNELAKSVDVHPNTLSQVINSRENRNFYDLVNEKRVNEFLKRVSQPGNEQFTLLGVAFDSGFNSKASFNRNFKKFIGQTPSEYLKQQRILVS